jgi:8-oxo-dGTP pyrophosphatase MutT (NUDIX family)
MNYEKKYLKYKQKYLNLRTHRNSILKHNQYGGMTITGRINKIYYCGFSMVVPIEGGEKVIYVQKFPPAAGTTSPNMLVPTEGSSSSLTFDGVSRETLINFWISTDSIQVNGLWKGGEWGTDNLITTSSDWFSGAFIGDEITLNIIADCIKNFDFKKQGSPFTDSTPFKEGSEGKALSCNGSFGDKSYGCYITEQVMPQFANDVLFIYKNIRNEKFIKLLRRGPSNPTVDMPLRIMPGAGEHLEPGEGIGNAKAKEESIRRAVQEEIGIPPETIGSCATISLGVFSDPGRDPRYWHYTAVQDGNNIEFGIDRGSTSYGYILYYKSDTDNAPIEVRQSDTIEIGEKRWIPFNRELLEIPDDQWMIIDHKKIVEAALEVMESI